MGLPPTLLLLLWLCPAPQALAPDPGLLAQGRARLREAQTLAQHPQLGACWAGALGRLDAGCQQLGEEQQSRMALAFAHCHLQRSGRPFPRCEAGSSVRACTQHMDPVAFGVYTEFFTHAHSICYLLRSEAWQQRAESTVHRLVASSEGVAERLEETNQLAEQAARVQEATLRSQEEILHHGELLRQTLQDSSRGVQEAFQDMQEAAGRQRLAFAEIMNRLSFLHCFLVGESQALGSFLYHLLTGSTALLLTCSQRTAGARRPLPAGWGYAAGCVPALGWPSWPTASSPTVTWPSRAGKCCRGCRRPRPRCSTSCRRQSACWPSGVQTPARAVPALPTQASRSPSPSWNKELSGWTSSAPAAPGAGAAPQPASAPGRRDAPADGTQRHTVFLCRWTGCAAMISGAGRPCETSPKHQPQ
ncbi:uncharacterized protein LOC115643356 isoform X3 [Gopherus evgoodei]|uniref:uncharacterized protein LOC115643356 isoform X3 n=1 Tax=Gopherus evgoodei TaxID=1825980 RepID=UPI0011CF4FF6|nr:uncharacterized protein LOC115643356 isoform X3 [Gopherus evgoodei]